MRIEDAVYTVIEKIAERPNQEPDPARTDREEVADWCGIRNLGRVPDWRVPLDQYRVAESIACSQTAKQPDPPWVVVARYERPDGTRAVLCHEAYADALRNAHDLTKPESEALALHHAGWTARDLAHDWESHHSVEAEELLADAKASVSE